MKLISNLHHSDQTSGTTVVEHGGAEYRAHWTEGDSDVIICAGLRGAICGVIRADGEASHEMWEDIKQYLENPGESARPMTEVEEADWQAAVSSAV
jgi:hypothetical protein